MTPDTMQTDPRFAALADHVKAKPMTLRQRYAADPLRRSRFRASGAGLTLHYDQNAIGEDTLALFAKLYADSGLETLRIALFSGEHINNTEDRPVIHTALRSALVAGKGPDCAQISAEFERCFQRVESIRSQESPITDIVNLGIGGSDLGPRLACSALADFALPGLRIHFCSSLDRNELNDTLDRLHAGSTLFVVSSKSFGTEETLYNARLARQWLVDNNIDAGQHMLAVTANNVRAQAEGFLAENCFALWDGVGGRYSLWSAIGLPIMLQVGSAAFRDFLAGAYAMDEHFLSAPVSANLPLLLAAIEVWHHNFHDYQSMAVLPYSYRLRLLPSYLQQLTMESNGKSVGRDGKALAYPTNPVVWGAAGTEGQHSFHQLLHQGTVVTPVDFILPLDNGDPDSSLRMASHCLAQRQALLEGKSLAGAAAELLASGMEPHQAEALAPHKVIPGNRPCNLITCEKVSPQSVGALIALYEHKTFASGVVWGLNSYDQWGVELGKQISAAIQQELVSATANGARLADAIQAKLG